MKIEFNSVIHRYSATPGVVPTHAELLPGELAINIADGKLFTIGPGGAIIDLTYLNSKFNIANTLDGYVLMYDSATNVFRPQPLGGINLSSFAITGLPDAFEIGQAISGSGVATWATNGSSADWQANSGYITATVPAGTTSNIVGPFNPTTNTANITFPTFTAPTNPLTGNSLTFSLKANKANGTAVNSLNIVKNWRARMYYGKSSNANLTTPTFDIATGVGSGSLLNTSNVKGPINQSVQVGAGAGYFYLFIHDSYTLDDTAPYYGLKYIGNLLVKDSVTTVQLTNSYGVTATYKRYKSTNILNDALTITINPTS